MSTKEIVLGVCALAAVMGAPQMFGDAGEPLPSPGAPEISQSRPFWEPTPFWEPGWWVLSTDSGLSTAAGRQRAYENTLKEPPAASPGAPEILTFGRRAVNVSWKEMVYAKAVKKYPPSPEAPKIFWADAMWKPVWRVLSIDPERQEAYENTLKATEKEIAKQRARLKSMGDSEVDCVDAALRRSHHAFFVLGIAAEKIEEASMSICRIQRELNIARDFARRTWFFKKKAKARVNKLEVELGEALRSEEVALQGHRAACIELERAEEMKKEASVWRTKRLEYFTGIIGLYMSLRGYNGPNRDFERLKASGLDVVEIEQIRVRAIQDLIVFGSHDALMQDVTTRIENLIRSHTDDRWTLNLIHRHYEQCRKLQELYSPPTLGYYYGMSPFTQIFRRQCAVFGDGRASELQEAARKAFSAAVGPETLVRAAELRGAAREPA